MSIKLIRLFAGEDGRSHFVVGAIAWQHLEGLNAISPSEPAQGIHFEETAAGAGLGWHNAPHRQYVITLSGRLEFETRTGARQVVEPGDVYLRRTLRAADIAGG